MENFMSQSKNSKKILKNFHRKEIIIHSGLKIHRFGIEDLKEGTTAFLDKRKADFPRKKRFKIQINKKTT